MNDLNRRDIEKLLTPGPPPEPPPGLAERLKAEIPEDLVAAPELADERRGGSSGSPGRRWLMAASVLVAVGGGLLAYRVLEENPVATTASDHRPAEAVDAETGTFPGETRMQEPSPQGPPPPAAPPPAAPSSPATGGEGVSDRGSEEGAAPGGPPGVRQEVDRQQSALQEELQALGATTAPQDDLSAERESRSASPAPEVFASRGAAAEAQAESDADLRERALAVPEAAEPGQRRSAQDREGAPVRLQPRIQRPSAAPMEQEPELFRAEGRSASPPARLQESSRRHVIPRPAPPEPPSTGGTDEPNQQPYGDVFFRSYGVNPFVDTEDDPLSTFGLEVDTASYAVVRGYLSRGHLPPPEAVRVEELLNSFDYGDRPPRRRGRDFALYAEGAPSPFADGPRYHLLRFGIRGRDVSPGERRPAVLTFVVDVSGSMERGGRLSLVKQALYLLLDELRPDDRVGLVTYGDRGRVLVEPTGDREAVRRALASLVPGGSTNAEDGLVLGYDLARRHLRRGGINRVVLCSDGVANVGRTGAEPILDRVAGMAQEGIELTTVGVGMGNYNDVLLEQLADRGNGRYAYVDTLEEAERIFVEDLTGQLQTIAAEARAQVEFDPSVVARYRLLGYENRDIPDERFEDLSVDAGEIGAGHSVVALYEIKLQESPLAGRPVAKLRLRYGSLATREAAEESLTVTLRDLSPSWDQAPRALRLAAVVAEFAEILRGSYWAREGDLDHVLARARQLRADYPGDPRVTDLLTQIQRARDLARSQGSPDEP